MRLILIFLIAFWTHQSFAKTIIEPSISLGYGTGEVTIPGFASAEGTGTVASFGFRYGITRRYIHVTGLIEGTMFTGEDIDAEIKGFGGIGVGWEWNIPLRTYFIAGAYDFDTDFIGAGVELAYLISDKFWVGLRYIDFNSEITQTTNGADLSAEVKLSTVSLVVSFPFEFNYPDYWFRKTDWQ